MSQPQGSLYEIRWNEVFPWLILVRALRVSVMARVLVLAFAGVLVTQWGWSAVDFTLSENSDRLERLTDNSAKPKLPAPNSISQVIEYTESKKGLAALAGPLLRGWSWLAQPFTILIDQESTWRRSLALSLSGIWTIMIWALFGGAISRIAAVYLTRGETLGPLVALKSALIRWGATAGAPLIVLLAFAALALPLAINGLLMWNDFLAMFAGIFWPVVLAWGLLLALVLLGLFLGWPLMWATVSVEQTDAFDGVSRCYAYVSQRPLHLMFYVLVAMGLGFLGDFLVQGIAYAVVGLSDWTISWGLSSERTTELVQSTHANLSAPADIGRMSIQFWKWSLQALVASYSVGYLWSASVGIYLLLRRHIDSTEMDEIAFEESDLPKNGLPHLEPDESGVPQVKNKNEE